MKPSEILDFLAEAGQLKRVKRSGWWLAGIKDPESVADHVYRTAILGHVLARMEGVDAYSVLIMTLYHDLPEARLNDSHKISSRYLNQKEAQKKVQEDQLASSDAFIQEIRASIDRFEDQSSPEAIVARDADLLECILQGKEYHEMGHTQTREWYEGKLDLLRTRSAKELYSLIEQWDSTAWRRLLKKIER